MSVRNRNLEDIITPKTSNEYYDYKIKSPLKRLQESMITEKKNSQPNSTNTSFEGSIQGSLFSGTSNLSTISKKSLFRRQTDKIPKSKLANPFDLVVKPVLSMLDNDAFMANFKQIKYSIDIINFQKKKEDMVAIFKEIDEDNKKIITINQMVKWY